MGAQKLNFTHKLPHIGGFYFFFKFRIIKNNLCTRGQFSNRLKFRGWQLPPPHCHDATAKDVS